MERKRHNVAMAGHSEECYRDHRCWQCCQHNSLRMGNICISNHQDYMEYEYVLHSDKARKPERATEGSAAFDVFSPYEVTILPHETVSIPLDVSIKPPQNCYIRTVSRSSLASRHQITCTADVVDPDYTGKIHMIVANLSSEPYYVKCHEKIGAIVFEQHVVPASKKVTSLTATTRGPNGFGSTGSM